MLLSKYFDPSLQIMIANKNFLFLFFNLRLIEQKYNIIIIPTCFNYNNSLIKIRLKMIKIARNILKIRQLFPHSQKYTYNFSQQNKAPKEDPEPKKQPQLEPKLNPEPEPEGGISMKQIVSKLKSQGLKFKNKFKKTTWAQLAALGVIGVALLYSLQSKQIQYPINLFEEELQSYTQTGKNTYITAPKKGFSNVVVNVQVYAEKVYYKIRFSRNDQEYVVSYKDQPERFKRVQSILRSQPAFDLKYKYMPHWDVYFSKAHLVAQAISIIFITIFFIRSMPNSNIQKYAKSSTDIGKMLGQKKQFDVITDTKVRFKDVAGLDQSKIQVKQFVDFLKSPEKYKKLGARIPKGVLLSGPPGTGKTMLAKACAGEAGVPFIPVSGSDFVQIFVGVGAARVRDLFATAKQKSPSIIFIDEIDAVGRKRSGSHGSHDERDNTLNQILVEMDGFETDKNVIVMAATNKPNLLDSALVRPGRFDRLVEITLPDLQGRRQIFNVHLQKIKMQSSRTKQEYSRRLATLTPGFSGAQIANLCNEAAILAARNGKKQVDSHDLQMATQRIIGGIERKSIITKQQKKVVSVHQSGHAVVSWFLKGADPLLKLTIIPRSKGSLGFAQYFVNQTKLHTRTQLVDRICFILGGRCAEQLFFGKITNGASDDLKKAYQLAHNYVVKLGMSQQLGLVAYKDPQFLRPYSEQMGAKIDNQIKKIITQCTQRTRKLVKQHEQHIKNLSDQLFEKQTLTIKQIRRILGERDFTSNQTYQKYLQIQKQLEKAKI